MVRERRRKDCGFFVCLFVSATKFHNAKLMCPSFFRLHSSGDNPEARGHDCSGCIEWGAIKQKHLVCHEKCSTGKCKYFNRN